MCGKEFSPNREWQTYCSQQCSSKYRYKDYKEQQKVGKRTCKVCDKEFSTNKKNQVFCSLQCRSKYYHKLHPTERRTCKICGKEFSTRRKNQAYCSQECWYNSHSQKEHKHFVNRICKFCGKEFLPTTKHNIFCSVECLGSYTREKIPSDKKREYYIKSRRRFIQKAKKPNYANFGDLRLWSEEDFEHWFRNNYVLFGIKTLLKIDRFFPDVLAETYDGTEVRIELELNAQNFFAHQHDPSGCDLIISFVKPRRKQHIKGVPVISIFDAEISGNRGENNYDPDSLHLTDYFQSIIDKCVRNLHAHLGTIDHRRTEGGEIE